MFHCLKTTVKRSYNFLYSYQWPWLLSQRCDIFCTSRFEGTPHIYSTKLYGTSCLYKMGQALQVTQICSSDSLEAGGADNCLVLRRYGLGRLGWSDQKLKYFSPSRRYASAGTSYGLCLSVTSRSWRVLSKKMNGLISFFAWRLLSTSPTLCFKEILARVLPSVTFS